MGSKLNVQISNEFRTQFPLGTSNPGAQETIRQLHLASCGQDLQNETHRNSLRPLCRHHCLLTIQGIGLVYHVMLIPICVAHGPSGPPLDPLPICTASRWSCSPLSRSPHLPHYTERSSRESVKG